MPGKNLTTTSQILCPHGGRATLSTTNTKVFASNALMLLESDIHLILGCPFTVGTKYSPCVQIRWSAGSTRVSVDGTATLVKTSIGKCMNAEGALQGVATIVSTQIEVEAQ